MRTERFKGAMLSALVIASMVTAALSISITSVSATHTSTVSIDDVTVKANTTMVRTITVQNAGPDAIDNVWIVVPSGFTGFAPVMNEPINWNQSVAAPSTAPPGTYVEWTGIDENRIASGASLAFPFAVTTPPAGGDYTIYVKTTDTTGMSALNEITLTIDNASPTVTIAASPSWVKDNVEVTITLTASESLAKLEDVMVVENNAPENTQILMTPNADNTVWTGTYTTGDNSKRDGTAKIYVVGAQFEDLVGNAGVDNTGTFGVDRLKPPTPNVTQITGFPTDAATTLAPGIQTKQANWFIENIALDNVAGSLVVQKDMTVKIRVGTTVSDIITPASGYYSKTITLSEGIQEIGIQYIDKAGNVGMEYNENVTYDGTKPSISITSPADGAIITDNTPLIRLTIADATLGVENATPYNFADNSGYTVQLRRDADNAVLATLTPKTFPTSDPFKSFTFENQWQLDNALVSENWYNIFVQAGDNLQKDNTYFRFIVQALTRDPICIEGNDDFIPANGVVSGSGTENDPYVIENWSINAENANGIEIRNTTAYFVVRNCVVENGGGTYYGIYLDNVVNGRVKNNTCANNRSGIHLYSSDNNFLTNNACENNNYHGIMVMYHSDNNTLDNNTCENNNFQSIYLWQSTNNTLANNTCKNNNFHSIYLSSSSNYNTLDNNTCENNEGIGIYLYAYSNYNTLYNNTCENNYHGICLYLSDHNTLDTNTCKNNNYRGIVLDYSSNNKLVNNTCENNSYAIYILFYYSDNNLIYHNNFINNWNQAYDECSNYWDNGYPSGGNYWSDYTGADNYRGENQDIPGSDGIGDTPYIIPGDNNRDRYPLMNPWLPVIPATIDIHPNTLNLKSRGRWITCYIELPEGYDVADIDIESIRLNDVVPAEPKPTGIDGKKLMVKFSRSAVQAIVEIGEVELTVTGSVNGVPFEGNDTIRVIKPGKADLELRFTEIPLEWVLAQPAERVELEMEFSEIPLLWALAPS